MQTICTYGRKWFFGKVKHKSMNLSPAGVLAEKFWCEIPDHFLHVQLGAYIVMPNHVHGILNFKTHVETLHRNVSVTESMRPKGNREHEMGKISPTADSLTTVIRSYKSVVTKQANLRDLPHGWQPKFYDRILRSNLEIQEVSAYIRNKPDAWAEDEFYGEEGMNDCVLFFEGDVARYLQQDSKMLSVSPRATSLPLNSKAIGESPWMPKFFVFELFNHL